MKRVLLKRNFNTPLGRFKKSVGGVPTAIPDRVVERYGLPRDAKAVDEDYIPPSEREDSAEETLAETAAQIEDEVARRVEEELAKLDAKRRAAALTKDEEPQFDAKTILAGSAASIKSILPELTVDQLREMKMTEEEGKGRKGISLLIDAAIEDVERDLARD